MSSVQLLDKTRKLGNLLHNNNSKKVVFNDVCQVMSDIMESNVFVISRKGKMLGYADNSDIIPVKDLITEEVGTFIDRDLNERFLTVLSTRENVNLITLGFEKGDVKAYHGIIAPIYMAGKRLGTLFIYKQNGEYDIDDIILCEYGATVLSLEMMRAVTEEHAEDNRRSASVQAAVDTLSATEKRAIGYIFKELESGEGILVTSKIADTVGITRSVIVNALRKLESAGIIESRSAGMKGTYIKVINAMIYSVVEE